MAYAGQLGRWRASAVGTVALALVAGLVLAPGGQAAPPASPEQLQRQVDALMVQADLAVEDYDEARLQLADAQRRSAAARERAAKALTKLNGEQRRLGALAAAVYRSGSGGDEVLSLFTDGPPHTFIDRVASLDALASRRANQMASVGVAQRRVERAQAQADEAVAMAQALERRLIETRTKVEATLAKQQRLLRSLRAEERAKLEARRARASRSDRAEVPANIPASGRAKIAVQWAYQQVGKPYKWGADGPESFDCSGMTMYVWGKAGVSLPHSSRMQWNSGPHVSMSELQPGDLVFYGQPIHHVGIYVGDGKFISATHSGDYVRVQSAFRSDFTGAVRVG